MSRSSLLSRMLRPSYHFSGHSRSRHSVQSSVTTLIILGFIALFTSCVSQQDTLQQETAPAQETEVVGSPSSTTFDDSSVAQTDSALAAAAETVDSSDTSGIGRVDSLVFAADSLSDSARWVLSDSLSRPFVDSLAALDSLDSLASDTLAQEEERGSDVDTMIYYFGEHVEFHVPSRTSVLTGNARIRYKDMVIEAYRIEVDWENDLMTATGTWDTVYTDSTETEIDSLIEVGMPVFTQGQQTMRGVLMRVNMETKQGYVETGTSEYGEGFYRGERIQKVSDKVLYVQDGAYTSCELDHPHYRFTGSKMKMIHGDKVVGKPVVLRFGDVPVAALPFAVFSTQRGRRSGIIVPTYGDNSSQGRHLRNFGYYWAASDYWDIKASLDFYERLGVTLRSDVQYRVRYKLNGRMSGSLNNRSAAGGGERPLDWDLNVIHNQDIDPNTQLRVNATFVSRGGYQQEFAQTVNRRLQQTIRSNATLSRRWPGTRHSLTMNLSHFQNLENETNNQTLPSIQYRYGSGPLFPSADERRREDTGLLYEPPIPRDQRLQEDDDDDEERWYNRINWSYSSRFENKRDESLASVQQGDSTVQQLDETWEAGAQHNFSMNMNSTVARFFRLTPSINYEEDWLFERRSWFVHSDGEVASVQERGFFQKRNFSASTSLNTTLYGYFNLNRWTVQTVRHVLTPSIGFSYRPDFSDPKWGLYQEITRPESDTTRTVSGGLEPGESIRKDRYEGAYFGGSPRGEQLRVNISITNLFQMKRVVRNEDGEEEEKKTDLFNYNLSTSYNFAADSLRWADLSANFRASPISSRNRLGMLERLNIDFSTRHSFYQYDPDAGRTVDEPYWERDNANLNLLRLANFSTTASFTLSGASPFVLRQQQASQATRQEPVDTLGIGEDGLPEIDPDLDDPFGDPMRQINRGLQRNLGGSPWRLSGTIRYSLGLSNPMNPVEQLNMSTNLSVSLTQNWSVQYSTSFDLIDREINSSQIVLTRDLHCWQGSFSWSPQGIGQGFFLHIGLKASQLQDLKFDRRRGASPISGML